MSSKQKRRPRRSWGKIRRLPSGRYQASYAGPDLARHVAPATFSARMDAEHWLSDERRLIERGEWVPPSVRTEQTRAQGRTFGAYADHWLAQRPLKPRTRALYRGLLDGPLAKLHKLPVDMVTAATIRTWHASLPDTPTRNAHAYALLHSILNTAVSDGLLTGNPAKVRGAMAAKTKREPIILSANEIAKVAVNIKPVQLKALVLISAWCGLRYGEAIELRRKDLSDNCEVINVARAAAHTNTGTGSVACHISTPKSGRTRPVVVPPHIRPDLIEHLSSVPNDPEALLFTSIREGCGHFNEKTARRAFHEAVKDVGRESVNLHDLRHFAGTQAARVGNLVETMNRLGHSTVGASLRYQHMVSGRDREVAEALSALAGLTAEQVAEETDSRG